MRTGKRVWLLIIISTFIISSLAVTTYASTTTTYYVANDGDDQNSGTSIESPWQTLEKVSAMSFKPGDSILLKSGDTWYESLIITSSGTIDMPITYGRYGTGDKPRILGSKSLSGWTLLEGSIWKSVDEVADPSYGANHNGNTKGPGHKWPGGAWFVYLDGSVTWGSQEKYLEGGEFSPLKDNLDWGFYDGHIYIYADTDPKTLYQSLEVSQRQFAVGYASNAPQNDVVVDGIEMMYCQTKGFSSGYPAYEGRGLTIQNCHIAYIGIKEAYASHGMTLFQSDVLIKNNVIHDTGRHGAFYCIYNKNQQIVGKNVAFIGNHFYNGFHTTGLDIQNPDGHTYKNFLVKDNLFEGSVDHDLNGEDYVNSNLNYIVNLNGGTYQGFNFYNNVLTNSTGKGFALSGISGVNIYHNTFYGVNPSLSNYQGQLYFSGEIKKGEVKNNIFYNNVETSYNPYFISMKVNNWHFSEIEVDNNLYYGEDIKTNLIGVADYGHFKVGGWADYNDTTGWDINSLVGVNPLFNNPLENDFSLLDESPAKDKAISISTYSHVNNDLGARLPSQNDTSIKVLLDGQYLTFDVDPIAIKGRTLVPLRGIFEALDLTVGWDYETQTVSGSKEGLHIKLVLGEVSASVNEKAISLDVPAKVINQRTLMPLRFVSEATGAQVTWDGNSRTVIINR